ncbi:N-acetylmuramoyl-L-alanine amidase [Bacillus oleivorans]|uniref:N-acetylmuramoyl-L-alanine amidase n=1 Tax=Bacillus oleivorans TaxID=1448271 RepID=A0A285CUE8_9BACI|nr:N-acetylmuramoyl-L-alanine amidase [Bacillus oleivorans]SNX71190.1 N-acetylmuramoyl-L-alanine amidase [Bacillus oleivorans]
MTNNVGKLTKLFLIVGLAVSLVFVYLGIMSSTKDSAAATDTTDSSQLQKAFEMAAKEFGVPQSVLMAVAYNQSRWDHHKGHSEVGGYGVMNLVHIEGHQDANGKNVTAEENATSLGADVSSINTLDKAAELLDTDIEVLKNDSEQNIRGGAALLAEYAKETVGEIPSNPADWYGAIVKYSGSDVKGVADEFADEVYATIQSGAERYTINGQKVTLQPKSVTPNKSTADNIPLRNAKFTGADCPNGLECSFIPARYEQFSSTSTDYGNYDIANRPYDGLEIRYIIIHNIEGSAQSAINHFRNKSYVSANYVIDSTTGKITQMVKPEDVAWQAGNWYFNMHSIGIEHEGYAATGYDWYSEQMYRSSAKLVKYLAEKYDIPLDRQHILGHDEVPGLSPYRQTRMHWDPGAYWDWSHFFNLLGAPINPSDGDKESNIVTISPNYNTNMPTFTYGGVVQEPKSSSLIQLYTEPSFDAPLIKDPHIINGGTNRINDWGNKAAIGQSYYKADQVGDWTAIHYGGQKAWFYNPNNQFAVPGSGMLITPKAGHDSIPVYGAAYPEDAAYEGTGIADWAKGNAEVLYQIPAGQFYVSTGPIQSDYYHAKYFNDPDTNQVLKGQDEYYQIFFNHRVGFVKKSDVEIVNP